MATSVPKGLLVCLWLSRHRGDVGYSVQLHEKRCSGQDSVSPESSLQLPFKHSSGGQFMEAAARSTCPLETEKLL